MNKDINNLREITDSVLKDIKVTDELKSLTLKKCREEKKYNIKPIFITAASAAIMVFSIFSYRFVLHNPDLTQNNSKESANKSVSHNNLNNNDSSNQSSIAYQDKSKNNAVDDELQTKSIEQQNNNVALKNNQNREKIVSFNNDKSNKLIDSTRNELPTKSRELNPSVNSPEDKLISNMSESSILDANADKTKDIPENSTLSKDTPLAKSLLDLPKSISIADAENFWGGKILTPSYIPAGFELTDISIPKDNSKEICVKLNYSFENTYFKIVQNKSTTYTNYVGTSIDIKGSKAYISKNKDTNNPNLTITEIKWMNNNIQYTIIGNISEEELTKVLKSIN